MPTTITVTKVYQRFNSQQRADMRSSHRLGFRQRESNGEFFWMNHIDGIAHKTRKAAIEAAKRFIEQTS